MATILRASLVASLVCFAISAALAETTPRHARKPAPTPKQAVPAPFAHGNINAPSTDFSKVERADGDDSVRDRGGLRPVMGAGGMGLGGGF